MFIKNIRLLFSVLLILTGVSACSNLPIENKVNSKDPFYSLQNYLAKEKVTDARFQRIDGYNYFLINLPLRYKLEQFNTISSFEKKKKFVVNILKESKKVGDEAMALYLSRLSEEQLNKFVKDYNNLNINPDNLYKLYLQEGTKAETEEINRIHNLTSIADIDQYWKSFVSHINESIMTKGRLERELETFYAVPFIKGWIAYHEATDNRGAIKPDFKDVEVYSPSLNEKKPEGISLKNWALLKKYAPIIVHETDPDALYSIENDRLGSVYLTGSNYDHITPHVDTNKPSLYSYIVNKKVQGHDVKQLVYTFFHPSHPQLSKLDPEAGNFDGWTIRITLDKNENPLDFESVSNCGCYYKNFPTDRLELLASNSFSEKLTDKRFYVENTVPGKYDAVVPELVTDIDVSQSNNIVIYVSAGHHQLITIRSRQHAELLNNVALKYNYHLYDYAKLENLPFNNVSASLFDTDGLVRDAHRPECTLLKPSGLYHAGHPRQRETQMIYFDESQFDDPALLETYLRLPPNAFGS